MRPFTRAVQQTVRLGTPYLRSIFVRGEAAFARSDHGDPSCKLGPYPIKYLMAMISGATGMGIALADNSSSPDQNATDNIYTSSAPILEPTSSKGSHSPHILGRYAVADAVEKVIPTVVNIRRVVSRKNLQTYLLDEPEIVQVSCGSGFFITSEGHILTNTHVVTDRPSRSYNPTSEDPDSFLQVTLSTGETYVGRLLAADHESDIAIVKVNTDKKVPVAKLGDSDAVRPGEFVVTVGSPLTLSNSCSFGIISTIHRDLTPTTGGQSVGLTYLQLDLAINQGSSGGPCVSLDGEVIGICSMKISGNAEGIGFAIPIKYAKKVVDDLQTHGYVRRPYVGLTLISVTPELFEDIRKDSNYRPPRWLEAEMRNTNSSKSVGLMVHNITKGGPGDLAGLTAGDVIVSVNDSATTTTSEFLQALSFQVHKDCSLRIRRGASGRLETLTIRPQVLQPRSKAS